MAHTHTDENGFPLQRRHEAHGGARKPLDEYGQTSPCAAIRDAWKAVGDNLRRGIEEMREAGDVAERTRDTASGETLEQWGDRLLAQEYDNLPTIPGCDDTKETTFDRQIRRDAKAGKLDALAERARAQCRAGNVADLYGNRVDY